MIGEKYCFWVGILVDFYRIQWFPIVSYVRGTLREKKLRDCGFYSADSKRVSQIPVLQLGSGETSCSVQEPPALRFADLIVKFAFLPTQILPSSLKGSVADARIVFSADLIDQPTSVCPECQPEAPHAFQGTRNHQISFHHPNSGWGTNAHHPGLPHFNLQHRSLLLQGGYPPWSTCARQRRSPLQRLPPGLHG